MSRPVWFVGIIKKLFPRKGSWGAVTRIPLVGTAIERLMFDGDNMFVLPLDEAVEQGNSPDDSEVVVLPSEAALHFIDEAREHWIMDNCICRDSLQCSDYPVDLGCIFLGEAAKGINPKLGRRVTADEARAHIQRAKDAGLVHTVGKSKLDTFWLGVGPGEKLLTICNCCPCCCIVRIVPHASEEIRSSYHRMPGVSVIVTDDCDGCGECTQGICFIDARTVEGDRSETGEGCLGCGRCATFCPQNAIVVSVDTERYVDETVDRLSREVKLG
jgi:4Fe-4S binding domain